MTAALLLGVLLAAPSRAEPSAPAERTEVLRDAMDRFLEGDYEKAAKGYAYLMTLGSLDADVAASLALAHRELKRPDQAAAYWLKATLLAPDDPFLWNGRAWNYLALGRFREARDSFRKAVEVSSASALGTEARFGLGLAESLDGNLQSAVESLESAHRLGGPGLQAAVLGELGRVAARRRLLPRAATFLTASLGHDRRQEDVARELGAIYEKTGQASAAWQAYKLTLDLDPAASDAAERAKKLESAIRGRPADSMPLVRMARPLLRSAADEPAAAGPDLRVALFSGDDGRPRHLTRFYVMGSTGTHLYDVRLGERIDTLPVFAQWEVIYRPDNRVIEVRDTSSRIVYVTRQPLRFEPSVPGHSVLIKNPEPTDIRGIDLSDRELRGSTELIPTPLGFHLVNELPLERYLYGIVGNMVPRTRTDEAYKAGAVLLRTRVLERMRTAPSNPERTHLCDSKACIPYVGLARERELSTQAVRATRGVTLRLGPGRALEYHQSCGGVAAGGVQDRPARKPAPEHLAAFERLLHDPPDRADFSEATADAPAVWTRWARVLDAEALRRAAERFKPVGPVKDVRVLRRDAEGRVVSLLVAGAHGEVRAEGYDAVTEVLSPGSTRSSLFSLQPIYRGRRLSRLIVWGAGSGHGRGLCIAGTLGQAHLGRGYRSILAHYFPGASVSGAAPSERRPPPRKRRPPPRKRR